MSLTLTRPSVVDLAVLARAMSDEERSQFETATGLPYSFDAVARTIVMSSGIEYLAIDDSGSAVSAFGCSHTGGGVWQTWMLSRADAFQLHGRELSRLVRRTMRGVLGLDGVRRIQTFARADRKGAAEWYERALGMRREGVMASFYQDGADAVIYAITGG